ncbi:MAG: ABC transporter ATP-binding protein [bacterium]|nr:ABC transporter ATP-binding protein [bacterium]
MALFALDQLSFSYSSGPEILRNSSFSFEPAQKIGFHGANGCGKSTFFLLVTGLLKPTSGHIRFHERILTKEKEFRALRREVGLVLQNAEDQLFHATVLEDVAFGPLNLGLSPAAARIRAEATLERLALSNLAKRLTHQLSGGEKRLIALASILSMQPRVLLLDEPTNDLDLGYKKKLMQILHELEAGWIIISHDFDFLRRTCTEFMSIEGQQLSRSNSLHLHQHVHAHPLGDIPHAHE